MIREHDTFCDNPRCALHVRYTAPGVSGRGEWATLADGTTYARTLVADHYYCHVCARDPENSPGVRLPAADGSSPADGSSNARFTED